MTQNESREPMGVPESGMPRGLMSFLQRKLLRIKTSDFPGVTRQGIALFQAVAEQIP